MTTVERLPALPFDRPNVLEVAPAYRALQAKEPVARVRTPAGDVAWLVTGYELVRALAGDERLGKSHPEPERAPRFSCSAVGGGAMGTYETEQADHIRLRRLLTPALMVKRMNAMRPHVQEIMDELCSRLAAAQPPADLHRELSQPLPLLVICELLGVPYEDRERFQSAAQDAGNLFDPERVMSGFADLAEYLSGLLQRKREAPGEDLLTDLLAAPEEDRMDESELVLLAVGLLFAGHETTAARIDLGTVLLLTHGEQLRSLRRDRSLLTGAVEEVLRMVSPCSGVVPRYARREIEVEGVTIRDGDLVLLAFEPANRDPAAFADPDRFDITRQPNQHLAFGHGHRFCLGAGLARVELQTVFGTLFDRFPTLRLAVPVEELRLRPDVLSGGLSELPVSW